MAKAINKKLSLEQCWEMVNRIQLGKNAEEIKERCKIADAWLTANEVISIDEYDDLMNTVAYLHCEACRA